MTKPPLRIVILHQAVAPNAPLDERDVLEQVTSVRKALKTLGHRVTVLALGGSLDTVKRALTKARPDCVFNLVETVLGRGALAPAATALLDALGLVYTGATTTCMAQTTNKLMTKRALLRAGLPTPAWVTTRGQWGFRPGTYIFKPISEGASVGLDAKSLVKVRSVGDCQKELVTRSRRLGVALFAERFIEGREFNVSLLGTADAPRVLPLAEIEFLGFRERKIPTIVGYRAKWEIDSFEYRHTTRRFESAPNDRQLYRTLTRIAQSAWNVSNCRGYARVDLRVSRRGYPYVLELNANPCLAPDAGFVAAANQAKLSYPQLIDAILRMARCEPT